MEIIYVKDIAMILGKSESAIRSALVRKVDWVPPYFRLGKKYAWVRQDVEKWLSERTNGEVRGASPLAGEASSAEGATSTVVLGHKEE